MISPTHVFFNFAVGQLVGVDGVDLKLLALGGLLPDLDQPQSFLGRIFPFVSVPLNRFLGHRRAFHGFCLWGLLAVCGVFWSPLFFVGLGAVLHCFLDAWNVSGVQALEPFSEKVCVLFQRSWRIVSGSKQEFFFLIILGLLVWAGDYVQGLGGTRAFVGEIIGSYRLAFERYLNQGDQVCFLRGRLRTSAGKIVEGEYLIIGKEGQSGLAVMVDGRVLHVPSDGQFLRARLRIEQGERWESLRVKGIAETLSPVFQVQKGKWKRVEVGRLVSGVVIGRGLAIDSGVDLMSFLED